MEPGKDGPVAFVLETSMLKIMIKANKMIVKVEQDWHVTSRDVVEKSRRKLASKKHSVRTDVKESNRSYFRLQNITEM